MPKAIIVILLYLLLNQVSAQNYSGTWSGAGYYVTGQSMTTVMQKMGAEKKISLQISKEGVVTGSLITTYDKSQATILNEGTNQAFTLSGKLDLNRQLLLLIVTHIKTAANSETGTPVQKPDSIYYSVEILKQGNRMVMAGGTNKKYNRNATAEWIGSSQGAGMGMNLSDNINMHLLPLNIKIEKAYNPLEREDSPPPKTIGVTDIGTTQGNQKTNTPSRSKVAFLDSTVARKPIIQRTIVLDTSYIKLDLYDNGEIDGDIATIILDGKTILDKQLLSARAATLYLNLSKDIPEHLIELYANNLGSIPPNTALLVLTCNRKRYEIFLSSNGTENGSVKLKFKQN
jgi:hypothetical protein